MTPTELGDEFRRLSRLLDQGLEFLSEAAQDVAETEREYRKAKGMQWVRNTEGPVAERQAVIDQETADLRYRRDLAEGKRRAALESVRARATQISMLQTMANVSKAEAEFSRTGPQEGP